MFSSEPDQVLDAKKIFAQGRLLGLPTETVYGLAAPIDRPDLIERIFELKGRPPTNPLIVHVGTLDQARWCVREWPAMAGALAEHFWPGPLTLVLTKSDRISDVITAGQETVALRMPDHPMALAVLRANPMPLVAPSANLSTRISPICAEDVTAAFRAEDVTVLDGGRCQVGIESTIVAVDDDNQRLTVLRPGMIDRDALKAVLPDDWHLVERTDATVRRNCDLVAPGQMRQHYRPAKPLTVQVFGDDDALAEARRELSSRPDLVLIELPDDPYLAARELYRSLRSADAGSADHLVLLLPASRLLEPAWAGIVNRLSRAARYWKE